MCGVPRCQRVTCYMNKRFVSVRRFIKAWVSKELLEKGSVSIFVLALLLTHITLSLSLFLSILVFVYWPLLRRLICKYAQKQCCATTSFDPSKKQNFNSVKHSSLLNWIFPSSFRDPKPVCYHSVYHEMKNQNKRFQVCN